MISTVRSPFLLLVATVFLAGYSFLGAAWTAPGATPPNGNTPAPINLGPDTQAKTGNLMANIMAAATSTWSPRYCDELGSNCWDPASGAPGGGSGLGIGQTWKNRTGTRSPNVWYQNTTGSPMYLAVRTGGGASWMVYNVTPSDTGALEIAGQDGDSGTYDNLYAIIPPNGYYKQLGRNAAVWAELSTP